METKKIFAISGWFMLVVLLAGLGFCSYQSYKGFYPDKVNVENVKEEYRDYYYNDEPESDYVKAWGSIVVGVIGGLIFLCGFVIVDPKHGFVAQFAGKYKGSREDNGYWWMNPFYGVTDYFLGESTHVIETIKVNDLEGNPVEVAAALVFRVKDMVKAKFDVEDYEKYLSTQSEAALRKIVGKYEYNSVGDKNTEENTTETETKSAKGLSSSNEEIKKELIDEINKHITKAGLEIIDANITHLSYAPEIAGIMLQKQQAKAMIAAREEIVKGAVTIVKGAVKSLEDEDIAKLEGDEKNRLVSNLLIVICGGQSPVPMIDVNASK